MKAQLVSLIALAMTTAAGVVTAQETTGFEPISADTTQQQPVDFSPMTRSERLRHYLTGTFGPGALAGAAVRADVGQMTGNPKEWGRDTAGYSARFGTAFAQHIIRGTLEYGLSSVLHEDNRYIRSGQKGVWKRTKYAVVSSFLARHDNGRRGFAFSRVGSAAGSAFISRAWLPASIGTVAAGANSFGITLGLGVASNVFREFWPDLKHGFRRH